MTAFARRRTWCQGIIVRCRYWISIAGQGIRRANGHQFYSSNFGAERICFRPFRIFVLAATAGIVDGY
jgi:hypothetical protein